MTAEGVFAAATVVGLIAGAARFVVVREVGAAIFAAMAAWVVVFAVLMLAAGPW